MALRDNRIAAESIGLNITKYKMMAFVTSAALAGAAGALYGLNFSSLQATKFNFNTSILILVFVVLGGLGNIWGSLIAAAALTVLPEMLRAFSDYRMLVYAIVLILVMLATNNPTFKVFFSRFRRGGSRKSTGKEAMCYVLKTESCPLPQHATGPGHRQVPDFGVHQRGHQLRRPRGGGGF